VIASFADDTSKDIFDGTDSKAARRIPKVVWPVTRRKLDMLNGATSLRDLRVPPANRLEPLKGALADFWSIRVNDQYRVIFRFDEGKASDVRVTDYH
jgi:toxin HigB-1